MILPKRYDYLMGDLTKLLKGEDVDEVIFKGFLGCLNILKLIPYLNDWVNIGLREFDCL